MADRGLGRFENDCDAPPYEIVKACHSLQFEIPEDVLWVRAVGWLPNRCRCGHKLPKMDEYRFTYSTDAEIRYNLGQCQNPKCRRIYWG